MNTEELTAKTLRISIFTSILIITAGVILNLANVTETILWAGLLALIISPFIGVIVTTVSLYLEKDMRWVAVAVILIIVSAVGMLIK